MTEATNCPTCGAPLPEPGASCAVCLLALGLEEDTSGHTEAMPEDYDSAPVEVPEQIGPYHILELIGEGGMGRVYRAEQRQPIRREVALKIIKLGMDTRQVIARFESERQALALMSHPNVARVLDAGSTPTGRPYFVMEYVEGVPISVYCDENELALKERLRLFQQACRAIQHAHHKGIIHRDIKPSNILVTEVEDEPLVKVIDFGIAKATSQRLTERTLFTRQGVLLGTPEYMSPEQAEADELEVDTRTDVYSLGVLLYELLVGVLPFDPRSLRAAGYDEIRRQIREVDPPRPSTRASTLGDDSQTAATRRRTDAQTLSRSLRGDLDWIAMKALEKSPSRRYDSPAELEAEIERHLNNEPVLARPPSATYRLGRWIRRHRVSFAAACLVVLSLVGGIAISVWQAVRATQAEQAARLDAETAEQVSDFLVDLFEVSDPSEARGDDLTARQILDRGSERLEDELREQPRIRARLMATIADIYRQLGMYDEAQRLLESTLALQEETVPEDDLAKADTLVRLGVLHNDRSDEKASQEALERAFSLFEGKLEPDDPRLAEPTIELAEIAFRQARYDDSEHLYSQALSLLEKENGVGELGTEIAIEGLGMVHARRGELELAEQSFRRVLSILEDNLDPDNPDLGIALSNLGSLLGQRGRDEEAAALLERALATFRQAYGNEHRYVATALDNLAASRSRLGQYKLAEELFLETLEIRSKIFGADHYETSRSYKNLGMSYILQSRFDEAEAVLNRALDNDTAAFGAEHVTVGWTHGRLADVYREKGELEMALEHYRRSEEIFTARASDAHPDAIRALWGEARVETARGRLDEAERLHRRALALAEQTLGPDHPNIAPHLDGLGETLLAAGQLDEARSLFERALAVRKSRVGSEHAGLAQTLIRLASVHRQEGEPQEAEALLERALRLTKAAHGPEHLNVGRALAELGNLEAPSDPASALEFYERAFEIFSARLGAAHPDAIEIQHKMQALEASL